VIERHGFFIERGGHFFLVHDTGEIIARQLVIFFRSGERGGFEACVVLPRATIIERDGFKIFDDFFIAGGIFS
jgi:hypothetical protein